MAIHDRVERYAPLLDLQVRANTGDGRTVDAYAAVFDTEQEVRDQDGHYVETIAPTAFDRTIAQRAGQFQVMFNHGKTMYGTPSEKFAMPYGKPLQVRSDAKGLFTSTEISKTPLGDEVLQLVKDGVLKGQSFSGAFVGRETYRSATLPGIRRTEIAMREYGLTPFPVYAEAHVTGVRSEFKEMLDEMDPAELARSLTGLSPEARAEVLRELSAADTGTGTTAPPATGHATRTERQQALRKLILKETI